MKLATIVYFHKSLNLAEKGDVFMECKRPYRKYILE